MKKAQLKNKTLGRVGYWQYSTKLYPDREYLFMDQEIESGIENKVFQSVEPLGERHPPYTGQPLNDRSLIFSTLGGYGDALIHTRVLNSLQSKYPRARIDVVTHLDTYLLMRQFNFRGGWLKHPIQLEHLGAYDFYQSTEPLHQDPNICNKDLANEMGRLMKVNIRENDTRLTLDQAIERVTRLPGKKSPRVAIQVNSGQKMKDYPKDQIVQLANILARRSCEVYLIGGSTAFPDLDRNLHIYNFTGYSSFIGEVASLLSQMDLIIAPDSVGAHIGGLLKIPTLVLLSVSTPHNFDSYPSVRVLRSGVACAPCLSLDKCPQGHDGCIAFIDPDFDPEKIAALTRKIIKKNSSDLRQRNMKGNTMKSKPAHRKPLKKDKKSGPARISVCMMVKDEEDMLPGCLDSIKPVADEIIVVDTGSTDRTIEIARSYGAKIYHHPWENDFSKHRNQSISYANGDWFLIIDADERLNSDKLDIPRMKESLSTLPSEVHVLLATVNDFDREGVIKVIFKSPRLFRSGMGAHYEGTVHNQPKVIGGVMPSDLEILHYGYDLAPDKMEAKFIRTKTLLKRRIEENPEDFEAYFYLSNIYASRKKYLEAVEYGEKCLQYLPETHPRKSLYQGAYYSIGLSHTELKDYQKARAWLLEGIKVMGDDVDLYFTLSTSSIREPDFEMLKESAQKYLDTLMDIRKDPMKTGLRFTHCVDKKCEDEARYRLLCACLALGELGSIDEMLEKITPSLSCNSERIYEVLHNLSMVESDDLLLKYTTRFRESDPQDMRLLEPLAKRFCQLSQTGQTIEGLLKKIETYDDPQDWPASSDDPCSRAEWARKAIAVLQNAEALILLAYGYSKSGLTEAADQIYKKGLLRPDAFSPPFFENGLYHFYIRQDHKHLDLFLNKVIDLYDRFKDLPEKVLLILALKTVNSENENSLAEITQAVSQKADTGFSRPILSKKDCEDAYVHLADLYRSSGKTFHAQIAYRIAHSISGEPVYLRKEGDTCFDDGDYRGALKPYRELLSMNYIDDQLLDKVHVSLEHLANPQPPPEATVK